jgi:hypothetical protein
MWSSRSDLLRRCGDRDAGPHRDDLGDLLVPTDGWSPEPWACHSARSSSTRSLGGRLRLAQRRGLSYSWLLIAASFSFVIRSRLLLRLAQGGRSGCVAEADA